MLFVQKGEDGVWSTIAEGTIAGRPKTVVRPDKKVVTVFTLTHTYIPKEKEYRMAKVTTWGQEHASIVMDCAKNKQRIMVFGTSMKKTDEQSGKSELIITATSLLPPVAICELFNWHKSTMRFGAQYEKNNGSSAEDRIRHDYEIPPCAKDHSI